jgi:hypothetical protein
MPTLITQNFDLHAWKVLSQTAEMKVVHLPGLSDADSGLSCDTFNIIRINQRDSSKSVLLLHTVRGSASTLFLFSAFLEAIYYDTFLLLFCLLDSFGFDAGLRSFEICRYNY